MTATTPGTLSLLAGRIGRHSTIYMAAAGLQLVLALISLAVVTRYLVPADYGDFALLLLLSSLLTLIYGAGSLQGTFSWVFGAAADEEGEVIEDDAGARDPRRALMTGVALLLCVAGVGTLLLVAVAEALGRFLIDRPGATTLTLYAGASAAAHVVWRLLANALRYERRPLAYLVGASSSGAMTLLATWILLDRGHGIEGAMLGQVIGGTASTAVVVSLGRRNLRPAVSLDDARNIIRRGRGLIPVVFSFYVIQAADVFFVSRAAPPAQVGLYRVAQRMGSLVSYWTSSLHMAWGPLRRDPLHIAADQEHGSMGTKTVVATYFVFLTLWAVLGCSLFAEHLVRVAPPDYGAAADLIPLTAAAFAFHGFYVLVYRTVEFDGKRLWFISLSVLAAIVFCAIALPLIHLLGPRGAPVAAILAWCFATGGLTIRARRAGAQLPFQHRRIWPAAGIALVCSLAGQALPNAPGWPGSIVALTAWAVYPALLTATGALPRDSLLRVAAAVRTVVVGPPKDEPPELDPIGIAIVELVVRRRMSPERVSELSGVSENEVLARAARALHMKGPRVYDVELGRYLLASGPFAERERTAARLWRLGVDPVEVDRLEHTLRALRRTS